MEKFYRRYFSNVVIYNPDDIEKKLNFVQTLVLSVLFLVITMIIFFIIEFPVAGYSKIAGLFAVIGIGLYFKKSQNLSNAANFLALASNLMFMVDVLCSGGIHSPALYWLMASAFFALIFCENNTRKIGTIWVIICFIEFMVLFMMNTFKIEAPRDFPIEWEETVRLVFVIAFLIYCSIILLFQFKSKSIYYGRFWSQKKDMNDQKQSTVNIESEILNQASSAHRTMIWVAIITIPLFPDFVFDHVNWQTYFSLRIGLILYFILLIYAHYTSHFSPNLLAFLTLIPWITFLSYVTVNSPQESGYVYNLNYSGLFIVSALFLLWKPYMSFIMVIYALCTYVGFLALQQEINTTYLVQSGGLLLLTVGLSSIGLTNYRLKSFKSEFSLRSKLEKSNEALKFKNVALENQQKKIIKQKHDLKIQNNELSELNDKLTKSETQLKESSVMKDKFFSIISHDLRAPIATLSSLLALVNVDEDAMNQQDQQKIFCKLNQSVYNIQILMDNLLTWAKTQMGSMHVVQEEFCITDIIKQCMDLFRENLERKNISISIFEDSSSACLADKNMIDLVIRNLISNAIKFTRPGGEIVCLIRKKSDVLYITIKDNGVGIKADDVVKLFNETSHFSTFGTQNEKGTGLGLLLSKEFINKNGGNIMVDSQYGKGASFTFTVNAA